MKGCPLRCLWCSNPECQNYFKEIVFIKNNCIACGKCYEICPVDAIDQKIFEIDRNICDNCGKCSEVCIADAKKIIGKWYSESELIREIEKDRIFYKGKC